MAAYKGAPSELQAKLRKVVAVWRDRSIFEGPIQAAIEARIDGMFLTAYHGVLQPRLTVPVQS